MIIKEIILENFLCYYDKKKFELSDGLNIILGENGEGKTVFFEALDWLFNDNHPNLDNLISAKAVHTAEIGSTFQVKVEIVVEQYEEVKALRRFFTVKKTAIDSHSVSNLTFEGINQTLSGQRTQVDAKTLLDQIFPSQIRKYSLFKGESELNIFKNEDALINLINLFSDAKHFEKYSEKSAGFRERSVKAVEQATRNNTKKQALYKSLALEIEKLQNEQQKFQTLINQIEEQKNKTQDNLADVSKHVENASALETINSKIYNTENKIREVESRIKEDFTTSLFDENWILLKFEKIHHQFVEKVARLSVEKRKQQSEFDKQLGIKQGEAKAKAEILNQIIPLPIGTPSRAHMEEMLNDQFCKVCNRPAEKGSDAYEFMQQRLEDYLKSQNPISEEIEQEATLFNFDNVESLVTLSRKMEGSLADLRSINSDIKDCFSFNEKRRIELRDLKEILEDAKKDRERIIGNSTSGADKLTTILKNFNVWQDDLTEYNKNLVYYQSELSRIRTELESKTKEKNAIDIESADSFLVKTRAIFEDIEMVFNDTKQKKFDEFIDLLEAKSNEYFNEINKGAFTGSICFLKSEIGNRTSVKIELQQNGNRFRPNQALETSMHISVLFAISQLTQEKRQEGFPLIFDAPTSSFGETKRGEFLNIISSTSNQIIILSKDFIINDGTSNQLMIKPEFSMIKRDKAFWIRLERPFDKEVLSTINTEVIAL